jgi:tetratricopeptide (TPR) repeat protein
MRQIRVMVAFQQTTQATADLQNWLTHTRLGGEAPGIDWLLLLLGAMLLTALIGYGVYSAILRNQVARNRHPGNLRSVIAALVFLAWIISFTTIFSQVFGGIVLAILLAAWSIYSLVSFVSRQANYRVRSSLPLAAAALILLTIVGGVAYTSLSHSPTPTAPTPQPSPQAPSPGSLTATGSDDAMRAYVAGNRAFAGEDFETAITDYSHAIDLDPQFAAAYVARGNAHLSLMEYDQALANYNLSIAKDPQYPSAYFSRATMHWLLGELAKAEEDYRGAVERDPDNSLYYMRLASVLYEEKKQNEVETLYRNAYQVEPRPEWALRGWLDEVLRQERFSDVATICEELRKEESRRGGTASSLLSLYSGIAHVRLKKYDAAISELETGVRANRDDIGFSAYEPLAEAYRAKGNVKECNHYLEQYSQRSGRDYNHDWCQERRSQ